MFTAMILPAIAACAGLVVGAFAVPFLAARILSYKWDSLNKWWWDQCAKLENFRHANPNSFPTARDEGSIGALGIWYSNAITQGEKGELTKEQVFALENRCEAKLHLTDEKVQRLKSQSELEKDYCLEPNLAMRIVCGLTLAASFAVIAYEQDGGLAQQLASLSLAMLALFSLAVSALCDQRARILPWEIALCVMCIGLAWQLVTYGAQSVLVAGALGIISGVLLLAATKALPQVMGMGDVRTIPAIICLVGADGLVVFVVTLAISLLIFVGIGALTGRITSLKDRIAMGPCLFIAATFGMIVPGLI